MGSLVNLMLFFYSLVSKDTKEMYYSTKRQQFLVDQGYSFKVIADLPEVENDESLQLRSIDEQTSLLTEILRANENDYIEELPEEGSFIEELNKKAKLKKGKQKARRHRVSSASLSGAAGRKYSENKNKSNLHPIFRKHYHKFSNNN